MCRGAWTDAGGNVQQMRISEKTVELTSCSQLSKQYPGRLIWFWLTQRQEAEAGFDACTKLGGWLLLFQFKASSTNLHSRPLGRVCRRFHVPHHQLVALQARVRPHRRIFYAFPLIGRTAELVQQAGDFVTTTWLLDIANVPALGPPTTRSGTVRNSGIHYVDVIPGLAAIHSDPILTSLVRASDLADLLLAAQPNRVETSAEIEAVFGEFWQASRRPFYRNAVGAVVLPS